MINVLNMTKTGVVADLFEFKFDFEFDNSSTLPTTFIVMGQRRYLIAEGSIAKNVSTNTYYRYNGVGKEWTRLLVQPSTPISTATQITKNGNYNVINDDVAGYNEVSVNVDSTLIEKDIAENGTYHASDDGVGGYSVVNVNVKASSAGTDVIFYDYDGTVISSYTANEFASLSALPDNPVHEGLVAQGWNWSLTDAKDYVSNYGSLNIGQMYITDDGRTRLYISLLEGRTSPILQLYLNDNSELDIDWGDGSTHSTFTSTSADYKSERHEYSTSGDYVIAITVVSGGFALQSSSTNVSSILWDGNNNSHSPDSAYNAAIKQLEIGNGVTSIGENAFRGCLSLSSITIPNSITGIGNYAFGSCSSLSSITIPGSVTSISENVFQYCYTLSSITIPNDVTSIGNTAFYCCYSLSSITIPNGVTSIGNSAFYYCQALSSITIPDNVTSIGTYAFNNCSSLSLITIPDSVTSIGGGTFYYCYSLSSITIPNGVTSIGESAFSACASLSSVTIPDTVTSIEGNAFSGCYSLSSITIPDSVTSIGDGAFYGCYSSSSIIISNSVTGIGNTAFYDCSSLSSVTIPGSVMSIGKNAFRNCSYMSYIKFESTTPPTVANSNAWSNVSTSTKILVPAGTLAAYKSAVNYPSPSTFTYEEY